MKQEDLFRELDDQEKIFLYTKILQLSGQCLGRTGNNFLEFVLGDLISGLSVQLGRLRNKEEQHEEIRERKSIGKRKYSKKNAVENSSAVDSDVEFNDSDDSTEG